MELHTLTLVARSYALLMNHISVISRPRCYAKCAGRISANTSARLHACKIQSHSKTTTVFSSIVQYTIAHYKEQGSNLRKLVHLTPKSLQHSSLGASAPPRFLAWGGAWVGGYISCRADASDQETWDGSYSANLTTGMLCTMNDLHVACYFSLKTCLQRHKITQCHFV